MLSIIWNVTDHCPWDCAFCVMNAGKHCKKPDIPLEAKLKIVRNLRNVDCRVDLSGGEVMLNRNDHLPLIKLLSETIGKDRLGISCSGAFIGEAEAAFLAEYVNDVEMTMDAVPGYPFVHRPKAYHVVAGNAVDKLKKYGVTVGLQTVVTRDHFENPKLFSDLYTWMNKHCVDEWSLLKYFPAGRGVNYPELCLSDQENAKLVALAKKLCSKSGGPHLDVHYLMPGSEKDHHCRCVKKSIGILPDGSVTSCFWGLDSKGNIKDSKFYLGNVITDPLVSILESPNAQYWSEYCGECPLNTISPVNAHILIPLSA